MFAFFKFKQGQLASFLDGGPDNEFSQGGFCFCWKDDENLFVQHSAERLTVSVQDDVSGDEYEILHWEFKPETLWFYRPWPGNIAFHFAPKSSCMLSSHLGFFGQLGVQVSPQLKLVEPQTRVTIDLKTMAFETEHIEGFDHTQVPVSIDEAAGELDAHLYDSIANVPADTVLLLSGGVDSAGLATLAASRNLPCLTWV